MWFLRLWCGLAVLCSPFLVHAQSMGAGIGHESITNRPIMLIIGLGFMALVPLVLVLASSFVKIAVVLSMTRQAIGATQVPPTQVLTGLSLILTMVIMTPLALEVWHGAQDRFRTLNIRSFDQFVEPRILGPFVDIARDPVRRFLRDNAHPNELKFFYGLTVRVRAGRSSLSTTENDFAVITPAFVLSELKEAFYIGILIFLPFLAVDMVIGNILMAMGMQMLSPQILALPFKMLLFVMVDGWAILASGLINTYR